ncbi:MAG TPA: transposase [Anaerolineales bacterium]|nr:transposase [Anaerolineales bacterium]
MTAKFDPRKPFDPAQGRHHRRSIRLKGYDYTQSGAYYITIVTYQRQHFFGEGVNGEMRLNALGQIAHDEWFKTAALRPYVSLYEDQFVVMPNHVHGIIWIQNALGHGDAVTQREEFGKPVSHSIPTIVRAYKSAVTYAVNGLLGHGDVVPQRGAVLWQRNYYEHIIRDEKSLQAIRQYILNNPRNWEHDENNKR